MKGDMLDDIDDVRDTSWFDDWTVDNWAPVVGFPDYEVSDTGFVRHVGRKYRTLEGGRNDKGYWLVGLRANGRSYSRTVHTLVADAFIPKPDYVNVYEVNHKDGNKDDNSVSNLEWLTPLENKRHALATGLIRTKSVRIIETGETFDTVGECAAHLGVTIGYIYNHLNGRTPTCRGYQLEVVVL
jgi:hypothetical protein